MFFIHPSFCEFVLGTQAKTVAKRPNLCPDQPASLTKKERKNAVGLTVKINSYNYLFFTSSNEIRVLGYLVCNKETIITNNYAIKHHFIGSTKGKTLLIYTLPRLFIMQPPREIWLSYVIDTRS